MIGCIFLKNVFMKFDDLSIGQVDRVIPKAFFLGDCMTFKALSKVFSVKTLASVMLVSSALYGHSGLAQEQPAAPINAPSQKNADPVAQPQPAPQARVQKFDDWYYRCVDSKANDGSVISNCEVAQIATVKQADKDVNILTLAIARVPAASAAAQKGAKPAAGDVVLTTLVPLNMYLPAGLSIDAGDKPIVQLAYRNCTEAGCWAQQKMDAKMIAALAKAADGVGHVQMMSGQKVNIKFSLKGLSAALDALQKSAAN